MAMTICMVIYVPMVRRPSGYDNKHGYICTYGEEAPGAMTISMVIYVPMVRRPWGYDNKHGYIYTYGEEAQSGGFGKRAKAGELFHCTRCEDTYIHVCRGCVDQGGHSKTQKVL